MNLLMQIPFTMISRAISKFPLKADNLLFDRA